VRHWVGVCRLSRTNFWDRVFVKVHNLASGGTSTRTVLLMYPLFQYGLYIGRVSTTAQCKRDCHPSQNSTFNDTGGEKKDGISRPCSSSSSSRPPIQFAYRNDYIGNLQDHIVENSKCRRCPELSNWYIRLFYFLRGRGQTHCLRKFPEHAFAYWADGGAGVDVHPTIYRDVTMGWVAQRLVTQLSWLRR
jgi:hypothetical protein